MYHGSDERVRVAIARLNEIISTGEDIYMAEWKKIYSALNIEKLDGLGDKSKYPLTADGSDVTIALYRADFPSRPNNMHNLPSFVKKLPRFKNVKSFQNYIYDENGMGNKIVYEPYDFKVVVEDLIKYWSTWVPVALILKELKGKALSGRKPVPKKVEDWRAPKVSQNVQKAVEKVLKGVVKNSYDSVVKYYQDYIIRDAMDYLKANNHKEGKSVYSYFSRNPFSRENTNALVDVEMNYSGRILESAKFKSGYKGIAKKLAQRVVDDMVQSYIFKNTNKIASIIEQKNVKFEISAVGNLTGFGFNGNIVFKFADETTFTVRNKSVRKWSVNDRPFLQFPTTFHGVVFPDGSKRSMMSEREMNEKWAKF